MNFKILQDVSRLFKTFQDVSRLLKTFQDFWKIFKKFQKQNKIIFWGLFFLHLRVLGQASARLREAPGTSGQAVGRYRPRCMPLRRPFEICCADCGRPCLSLGSFFISEIELGCDIALFEFNCDVWRFKQELLNSVYSFIVTQTPLPCEHAPHWIRVDPLFQRLQRQCQVWVLCRTLFQEFANLGS